MTAPDANPELWAWLSAWRDSADAGGLRGRMITDLAIHPHTANRALDAYVRFADLACVAPEQVIPSASVAQTAALHWKDRRAFSEGFTEAVLGQSLPSKAFVVTPASDPGHARARALHEATFDARPDPHVWHGRAQTLHIRALYSAGAFAFAGVIVLGVFGRTMTDLQLRITTALWGVVLVGRVILALRAPGRSRERTNYRP